MKSIIIIPLFVCSLSLAVREPGMPGMGGEMPQQGSPRPNPKAEALAQRRQQYEQDAQTAISEIETQYSKYVGYVNTSKVPDDANIRADLRFITRTRKFLPLLNKQKNSGTYYALSAWIYYFDDKPDKVQKQIAAGLKEGAANANFIRSAFALALLTKDYNSIEQLKALTEKSQSEDAALNNTVASESMFGMPTTTENNLNIDVNSIKSNLLGRKFAVPSADSDQKIVCALLWQVEPDELERFAPPAPKPDANGPNSQTAQTDANADASQQTAPVEQSAEPASPGMPGMPMPPMPGTEQPVQEGYTESKSMSALSAFTNLQSKFKKNPKVVFVGINLNDPVKAAHVENWLTKNHQPWLNIPPSENVQQAMISVLGDIPKKPLLVISGQDSKVRYVGDVNNFLPNMLIQKMLANPQAFADSNDVNESQSGIKISDKPTEPVLAEPAPQDANNAASSSTETIAAPQVPTASTQPTPPAVQPKDNSNEFTETDYEAQKDLEYARTLFKIANRMQYRSYAKPIELCRNIISKNPNSKYAEEARLLLRQVPERFRGNYHITDAELGL